MKPLVGTTRCPSGKKGFATPQLAQRSAEAQSRVPRRRALFHYRCPDCGEHHLTHLRQDDRSGE